MKRGLQGRYVTTSTVGDERVRAFVPSPLPPDPPIEWTPGLRGKFDQALVRLGRLDGLAETLPDRRLGALAGLFRRGGDQHRRTGGKDRP